MLGLGARLTAQLKCICTNARSMGNKQEKLEAIVQQDSYDLVAITETWWEDLHDWSAEMDAYKLFREVLVGDVVVGGCLGCSDHEMIEFSIFGETKKGVNKTTTMDFRRADFGWFRTLVERVPWERVLKGKRVQAGWTFFKEEVLKAQEQAVPMCRKTNRQGRRLAWLNRELLLGLKEKKEGRPPMEERAGNSRGVQGSR